MRQTYRNINSFLTQNVHKIKISVRIPLFYVIFRIKQVHITRFKQIRYSILKNIRLSIRKKYAKTKRKSCLKYDLEYDILLYFEYILNLEGHTLKNSFMSDFTLYFALATGRIATTQSINQS